MDCKRCGTCCEKGGPILHRGDMEFLKKGIVSMAHLQVIRTGELAFNPFTEKVEPAPLEMLKLAVPGESWECPFHQRDKKGGSGCTIHRHRPLECRVLQCWNTSAIEALTFKDCLTRFDLIGPSHPLLSEVVHHEKECGFSTLWQYLAEAKKDDPASLEPLQRLLDRDLEIRQRLVCDHHLNLQQELFYLGQPMFRVLRDKDIVISFANDKIQLGFKG